MLTRMPRIHRPRAATFFAAALLLAGPAQADSFLSWYAKAKQAQARHETDTALEAWSNALHLWKSADGKPKKSQALAARAALYEQTGKWEEALSDLTAALKTGTKDALLFHRHGVLCLDHGRVPEAISDFYQATALKLDYAEAFFDRGRAYALQDDAGFSREDFRTACRLGWRPACAAAKGPPPPKGSSSPAPKGAPAAKTGAAPAPPPARPLDWDACISRISSCSDDGESYSACVSRARLCENDSRQGCCPRSCVALFKKFVETKSEAEAFRTIFKPHSSCLPKQKR